MNRKISYFLIFLIVIFMINPSYKAYGNHQSGLLSGKSINFGASATHVGQAVSTVTDNNHSSYHTLESNYSGQHDFMWYAFSSPVSIDKYYLHSDDKNLTGTDFTLFFYDSTGATIFSQGIDRTDDGTKGTVVTLTTPISGVSKVAVFNPKTGSSNHSTIYEFNVYEKGDEVAATTTTDTTLSLTGGNYEINTPSNLTFGTIVTSSQSQILKIPIGNIIISDLTGSGQGWRLQAQATRITNGTDVFPINSLSMQTPKSVAPINGTTSTTPTLSSGFPWFLDSGSDVTILTAPVNSGMGSYNVDFTNTDALSVNVSPSLKVGNYNTTITWKIIVGP